MERSMGRTEIVEEGRGRGQLLEKLSIRRHYGSRYQIPACR